jgi:hypothetical protein
MFLFKSYDKGLIRFMEFLCVKIKRYIIIENCVYYMLKLKCN